MLFFDEDGVVPGLLFRAFSGQDYVFLHDLEIDAGFLEQCHKACHEALVM